MAVVRPPEFDPKWRRKRRWAARWHTVRPWLVIAAIVAAAVWFSGLPTSLRDASLTEGRFTVCGVEPGAACVIDGDTIAFGERRVRLTGYDAPELDGACEAEQAAAREARTALLGWLNRGPFYVDGGDDPPRDQYGRELRAAWRVIDTGEEDWLADRMIADGFGEEAGWGASSIDWCG